MSFPSRFLAIIHNSQVILEGAYTSSIQGTQE
jgi:hypothetical protein